MGGARFEPGTPDSAAAYRLGAAVDLILELGIEAIEKRVLALRARLDAALDARGIERSSPSGREGSGIASFRLPYETATETRKRLRERGIHVASRGDLVRVSPHFYNDEDEIDRLLALL